MADTENIEAKLAAYVDDELDDVGRAEIEQHLAANPEHRRLIDDLRQTKQMLRELPRAGAPPEVAEAMAAHMERAALLGDVEIGGTSSGSTHFSRWPQFRAIAAVLLLTLGLAAVLYKILPSSKPSSPHVAIVVPEASREELTSDDRPRVELNSEADALAKAPGHSQETLKDAADSIASVAQQPVPEERQQPRDVAAGAAAGLAGSAPVGAQPELLLVVESPDPAAANRQTIDYLINNSIAYQPLLENESKDEAAHAAKRGYGERSAGPSTPTTSNANETTVVARAIDPTTAPADQPVALRAMMTRDEAMQLGVALSQPQQQQLAQVILPDADPSAPLTDDMKKDQPTTAPAAERGAVAALEPTTAPDSLGALGGGEKSLSGATQPSAPPLTETANAVIATTQPATPPTTRPVELAVGDKLRVRARDTRLPDVEPVDETVTIGDDGAVVLPQVGRIVVAGGSVEEIQKQLSEQNIARMKESQTAFSELSWSVERLPAAAEAAQQVNEPATVPATSPADAQIAAGNDPAPKQNVVIQFRMRRADIVAPPTSAPATAPTTAPATMPSPVPATTPATQPDVDFPSSRPAR